MNPFTPLVKFRTMFPRLRRRHLIATSVLFIALTGTAIALPDQTQQNTASHTVKQAEEPKQAEPQQPQPQPEAKQPVAPPPQTIKSEPVQPPPKRPAPTRIVNNYPARLANAPLNSFVDEWGMYNRQCTSYTAWKVASTFGNMPNWTTYSEANAPHAFRWPAKARAAGFRTGSVPKVHSVAVANWGSHGHTMWVERVNEDGTITVSHYNADYRGNYGIADIKPAGITFIYFGG